MAHQSASRERAESDEESRIRGQLANVLEQARLCLARLPALQPGSRGADAASAGELMRGLQGMLSEALQLNEALRDVENLSVEGAMCCGAVTIALGTVTDALAIVQAQLDSFAA